MSPVLLTLGKLATLAPAWPALGVLLLSLLVLWREKPTERSIVLISQAALWLSLLSVLLGVGAFFAGGMVPLDIRLGHFYQADDYGFELLFLLDGTSLSVALLASVLLLATSRFSVHYLHREPGFLRFFLLMLTFGGGMLLLLLSGSYDLLFAGWEVVGLTSVLLVSFFHERTGPIRASLRVLVTYRICDIGLLLGAVSLHLALHTTGFVDIHHHLQDHAEGFPATAIGLLLLFAAMGKSALFPVGGWLPRAMEGPTASSAVFYGGLSVHAGVYLLIRSGPIFAHSPWVQLALVLIGGISALMATLSGQVSADAKTSLVYATISQVGLMVVLCGLGFYRLATLHLVSHALLRYYQFLRTPSVLQDTLQRRSALGMTQPDEVARRFDNLPSELRRFIYRLAVERFEVEAALDSWFTRPVLRAARVLSNLERRFLLRLPGHGTEDSSSSPGAEPSLVSEAAPHLPTPAAQAKPSDAHPGGQP